MSMTKLSLLFTLVLVAPWTQAAEILTQDSVKRLMESVYTNIGKQDPKSVVRDFTNDAQITLDLPERLGGHIKMNIERYQAMLRQTFAIASHYEFEVRNTKIYISSDQRTATVTEEIHEKMQSNGITIVSSTTQTANIVLDADKPKLKKLYGHVKVHPPVPGG
jgi:hypothetical protein